MFTLTGILKKEEIKEYTKKDGTAGLNRSLYIEPKGSVYPVKVNCSDMEKKIGKEGDNISLEVAVFPFYFTKNADGTSQRKRAFLDVYIPSNK